MTVVQDKNLKATLTFPKQLIFLCVHSLAAAIGAGALNVSHLSLCVRVEVGWTRSREHYIVLHGVFPPPSTSNWKFISLDFSFSRVISASSSADLCLKDRFKNHTAALFSTLYQQILHLQGGRGLSKSFPQVPCFLSCTLQYSVDRGEEQCVQIINKLHELPVPCKRQQHESVQP